MRVHNYTGEFRVDEANNSGTLVTCSVNFDVVSSDKGNTVKMIRQFLKAGLDGLRAASQH
jgi:hypothetical protein